MICTIDTFNGYMMYHWWYSYWTNTTCYMFLWHIRSIPGLGHYFVFHLWPCPDKFCHTFGIPQLSQCDSPEGRSCDWHSSHAGPKLLYCSEVRLSRMHPQNPTLRSDSSHPNLHKRFLEIMDDPVSSMKAFDFWPAMFRKWSAKFVMIGSTQAQNVYVLKSDTSSRA